MRNRPLPLALLIAASLAPVASRSANDDSANNSSHNTNFAAEQTADSPADGFHNSAPISINDPNKDADSTTAALESKYASPAPGHVKKLAQQIATIKQTDQKRLDQQARRIDTLDRQVKALTKRLRQLPQPTASRTASDNRQAKTGTTSAPDAVSPQSDDAGLEDTPESNTRHAADSGHNDESADDNEAGDTGSASSDSPPAPGQVTGPDIVTHCPIRGDAADQFDVFFQAASGDALDAATDQVRSAGLSDWFARARVSRLYVGRYGNCPLAARRRDDVHQRTGLVLNIRAVRPHHTSVSKSPDHNPAASIRRAATQPVQSIVTNAPFEIIGTEIRGTHHYLGVAPHGASRLGGVTWLSPGDSYGTWTLRAIRTDAGTATFAHDGRTIAVALPRRG